MHILVMYTCTGISITLVCLIVYLLLLYFFVVCTCTMQSSDEDKPTLQELMEQVVQQLVRCLDYVCVNVHVASYWAS